jgi:hypothetical protein
MQLALRSVIAITLAALVTGCSSGSGLFGTAFSPAPLSPAEEAQEDQKCQSTGYQINTPAYEYCRGELARQRVAAESYQAVPSISPYR